MYNTNQTNIGEILRNYRKIKHLSLEDVGNKIYKSKATISKYEKGAIIPDFITTLELCNVLGINLSDILSLNTENTIFSNPFNTDTLYLYYVTANKLISSIIKINNNTFDVFQAQFYNGVKTDIASCAYYYEGSLEFLDNIAYVNLKNVSTHKLGIERVQIIISLPLSNTSDFFNCFVTGLTPTYLPIIKKGLISTFPLEISKINIKKLKLSRPEVQKILNDNAWILDSKLYDEFYYDSAQEIK